jgi:hypothetical protein
MSTDFYIGKRLSYDWRLCTVRYHGEVQGTKGEWLGVEWDDPTRGKHAGEHQGVKYFECECIPYAEILGVIPTYSVSKSIFVGLCPHVQQGHLHKCYPRKLVLSYSSIIEHILTSYANTNINTSSVHQI